MPPALGVCYEKLGLNPESTSIAIRRLKENLMSCTLAGIEIDCGELFSIFTNFNDVQCLITAPYKDFSFSQTIKEADLKVILKRESALKLWFGDPNTINEGQIHTNTVLEPDELIQLSYQQWEVVNMPFCSKETKVTCPGCSAVINTKRMSFCCTREMRMANITRKIAQHCTTSFYYNSIDRKQQTSNDTVVEIQSGVNIKRVITQAYRRTKWEEFMLYAGYIDFFIGINFDNILYIMGSIAITFVASMWYRIFRK